MRLYTCQPLEVYIHLMDGATWVSRPFSPEVLKKLAADDLTSQMYERAYLWLVKQMNSRGLIPSDRATGYPIWAWQQWNGISDPEPHIDDDAIRIFAKEKGTHVLLALEVDESRVLLSDYDAWHFTLDHKYLGTEEQIDDFERRCKEAGVDDDERPLQNVLLQAELEQSWEGIFDPERSAAALQESPIRAIVQATFWELRPEDVIRAVKFDFTGPAAELPIPRQQAAA